LFPDLTRHALIALLLLTAFPLPLLADELRLIPGLAVKEEFNDNIFLKTVNRQTDFVTTVTPSLDLSGSSEIRSLSLSGGLNRLTYARHGDLDSLDYYVQGGVNYQYLPRLSLSAAASYVKDSRPDRIGEGGLTLKSGSDRQSYQLSGNYAVSEKSAATASYSFSREDFDNAGSVATTVHSVNIGQDFNLNRYLEQAKLVGNFGYSRNLTDISLVDNYTVTVGVTKKIHELWNVSLNAGGRYTHSEFDAVLRSLLQTVTVTVQDEDLGWIGNLSLSYSDDSTNASLTFNHDVTTASGRNGTTERTGASASLSERFTRELSGFAGLGYSWNRSGQNQFSSQSIDEKNFNVNSGLRYDFSDYISLEGNYRFNTIYYGNSATRASQNVFMLRLTMQRDVMDL
jgi:hypothetical protein